MDAVDLIDMILVSTSAIISITLGLAWRMFDRPRHARTWAVALAIGAILWALELIVFLIPSFAALRPFAGSVCVALMTMLLARGARQRAGLPDHTAWQIGAGLLFLLALAAVLRLPIPGARVVLTNGFAAVQILLAAAATRPVGRRANPSERLLIVALLLIAAFAVTVTLVAARVTPVGPESRLLIGTALPPLGILLGVSLCFVLAGDLGERLHALVTRDPLTGALNRRGLEAAAGLAIAAALRHRRPLTLVIADLDRFKAINDARGHAAGDHALCRFADAAQETIRGEDLLARLGGDEFCLLLSEAAADAAMRVVERIRAAVGGDVTASFGVAALRPNDSLDDLISRADAALYRAKADGRDRAVLEAA